MLVFVVLLLLLLVLVLVLVCVLCGRGGCEKSGHECVLCCRLALARRGDDSSAAIEERAATAQKPSCD